MPVIINETEIVVEPPPAPAPSMPTAALQGAQVTPEEIMRVVQRQSDRVARVWAD
ncbi:MAG: hypothetical protein KDH08_06170 [Anaerolineae bacterium]|nr:hypothetical protein [Anaerolineae bacterium]MCB0244726.1 hypothetical protein [Anaerolineae bacterium]MCO5242446.1 hypothetical protein [Anaerolineae bacterium]